jgi:hypothetical protein
MNQGHIAFSLALNLLVAASHFLPEMFDWTF